MSRQNKSLIQCEGVERVFEQGEIKVHALRGVDLTVEDGEFSALAGPSGSGKTTLLNQIGVLDNPTAGTIKIDGRDVSGYDRTEGAEYRLGNIGFVFQAYNLLPVLTAYENAEFILMLQGKSPQERRDTVIPLLERVGLEGHEDRKPHELSGGQQQRVAVVRALAAKPRIVLADEPTANLDSESSAGLLDLMAELNREHGVTFLFSSHDYIVLERARRVIYLEDGNIDREEHKESAP